MTTYNKTDLLDALVELEDRLAGIRWVLEQVLEQEGFSSITTDDAEEARAARSAGRIKRTCGLPVS